MREGRKGERREGWKGERREGGRRGKVRRLHLLMTGRISCCSTSVRNRLHWYRVGSYDVMSIDSH